MSKQILFLILSIVIGLTAVAQPTATIQPGAVTSFCQSGTAEIKIKLTGAEPFGYSLKTTKTSDGSLVSYATNLGTNNLGIFQGEYINGFYVITKNIVEGYTYELVEVFDNTNWSVMPANYQYSGGAIIGSSAVSGKAAFIVDKMPVTEAGIAQSLCGYSTQLLATPNYSDSQIYWDVPAQGTISNINSTTPQFTATLPGSYTLTFNEKRGACTDQDQVIITLKGTPKATISGETAICGTGNLNATIQLQGESPWKVDVSNSDGSQAINQISVTSSPYSLAIQATGAQTHTLKSVSDKNSCTAQATDMTGSAKTTDNKPTVWAGDDKTVCGTNSTSLTGTSSNTSATITWSANSASAITPTNQLATNVSIDEAIEEAVVEYTLTVNNSGCSNSDKVSVFFAPTPELSVLSPLDTICEGSSTDLSLQISVDGPWQLQYSKDGTAANEQFTTATGKLSLSPTTSTDYIFDQITDKNNCSNTLSQSWLLTVEGKQTANAGTDQTFDRQYSTQLDAEPANQNSTGKWTLISGSKAKIDDNSDANTTVDLLAVGTNKFEWEITPQVCPASKDTMLVTVNQYTTYNGFSPNGDQINDFFVIEGANSDEENELTVYDAKGKLVYREKDYKNLWTGIDINGSPLESGTYYFVFTSKNNTPIKEYLIIRR